MPELTMSSPSEERDAAGTGRYESASRRAEGRAATPWSSAPEPLSIEMSRSGRRGMTLPADDVGDTPLGVPEGMLRRVPPAWPQMSENEVVRHFTRLSAKNHHVDKDLYPLGSCTMKYNPKVNEAMARIAGIADLHPLQHDSSIQGALALMWHLERQLMALSGFDAVSLQPAAGAQGELTGLMVIRSYHASNGDGERRKRILLPDSAHGTNPASVTLNGFVSQELKSNERGRVDLQELETALQGDDLAGLMITNPNTLGLFETNIDTICEMVHQAGGLVYMDGANFNALMGIVQPGRIGVDVMHFNLHKTFSTPHGGGGPGAGPVGVVEKLADFLPGPIVALEMVEHEEEMPFLPGPLAEGVHDHEHVDEFRFIWHMPPHSIGRVRSFFGNFGVLLRAYTYIRMHGPEGLRHIAENAVLNANYLKARLQADGSYPVAFGERTCMHEFVAQGILDGAPNVHTLDIAKRLMDYRFHPPTVYFPLIVKEALMIEPTETESKQTLDAFADALIQIAREARETPDLLHSAPHKAPLGRLDEVRAARDLILCRC